jgi:hypothetical protein
MKKGKKMDAEKKDQPIEAEVVGKEGSNLPAVGILAIAPPKPMPQRIEMINKYHAAAMTCLAQGAGYALLCGFELHAARATIGHGGWLKWVETNCHFHVRSAQRYMEAAERKAGEISNATHVSHLKLLARSAYEMTTEEQKQVIEAVQDKYADKTARQLWFELGALKPQIPKKNLPIKTPKDLPPGVSQAEFDKARRACRLQEWNKFLTESDRLICKNDTFQDIERGLVDVAYHQLQKCARVLKVYLDKTE